MGDHYATPWPRTRPSDPVRTPDLEPAQPFSPRTPRLARRPLAVGPRATVPIVAMTATNRVPRTRSRARFSGPRLAGGRHPDHRQRSRKLLLQGVPLAIDPRANRANRRDDRDE